MRNVFTRLLLTAILSCACLGAVADDSSDANDAARINSLLQRSGYNFTAKTDTVWTVDYHGKALGSFKVILATQNGLLVTFVIVAHHDDILMDQDLAMTMLKLNHNLDRVKVGIDDDGDAFVRADENVRVLDQTEFKDCIEQVAASADETYAAMKPYLKTGSN